MRLSLGARSETGLSLGARSEMGLSLGAKLGDGTQPGGSMSRRGWDITGNNAPQTASGNPRGHLADLVIHTGTNHTVLIH